MQDFIELCYRFSLAHSFSGFKIHWTPPETLKAKVPLQRPAHQSMYAFAEILAAAWAFGNCSLATSSRPLDCGLNSCLRSLPSLRFWSNYDKIKVDLLFFGNVARQRRRCTRCIIVESLSTFSATRRSQVCGWLGLCWVQLAFAQSAMACEAGADATARRH